jgi:hypothetical protein
VDKSNLLYKGETVIVKDKGVAPAATLRVARLNVGDNADPEPGGWRRMANVMKNDHKLALAVEPVSLGGGKLGGYKVAHLTGTTGFKLDDAARKELADFVAGGGTLVVDAAGGSAAFADAAELELAAAFGADAARGMARRIRSDHPVFNLPGVKLDRFGYRRYARKIVGDLKGPRLKGIQAAGGNRVGVFYSREDLSGGMVGQAVDGVVGYDVATATALVRNILLYASVDGNVAALAQPAPKAADPKPAEKKPADPAPKKAEEPLPF